MPGPWPVGGSQRCAGISPASVVIVTCSVMPPSMSGGGSAPRTQLEQPRVVHADPLGEEVVLALLAAEDHDERDDGGDRQGAQDDEDDDTGPGVTTPGREQEEDGGEEQRDGAPEAADAA